MGVHSIAANQMSVPVTLSRLPSLSGEFVFLSQSHDVSFAAEACIEVLRAVRRLTGDDRYRWSHHIVDDLSNLREICTTSQTLVLIGGLEHPWLPSKALASEFRALLRKTSRVCVVGSAVFVPITLGLSRNERFSVHPNFHPAVQETNPMLQITNTTIHHDTSFSSAISSTGAVNMMVELIGARDGEFTRANLTKYLGLCDPDEESGAIDLLRYQRRAEGNPIASRALRTMQDHLEDTLSIRQIAVAIEVSPRQLERSFRDFLAESPLKVYRNLRLDRARVLLTQTPLPIYEVSLACGFSNASLLSRWFVEKYGEQPSQVRRQAYGGSLSI